MSSVFVTNLENLVSNNKSYRKVINTSKNQQLVLMSLKPSEDIPMEVHPDHDQFFYINSGMGIVKTQFSKETGTKDNDIIIDHNLLPGTCVMIPAGTQHQVINTSLSTDLNLYTIYSPPEHPYNREDITRPQNGGSDSEHKRKYLKYKKKYIDLKYA